MLASPLLLPGAEMMAAPDSASSWLPPPAVVPVKFTVLPAAVVPTTVVAPAVVVRLTGDPPAFVFSMTMTSARAVIAPPRVKAKKARAIRPAFRERDIERLLVLTTAL